MAALLLHLLPIKTQKNLSYTIAGSIITIKTFDFQDTQLDRGADRSDRVRAALFLRERRARLPGGLHASFTAPAPESSLSATPSTWSCQHF